LPFILLPIKNPFVFSTKKKKERKTRQICAAFIEGQTTYTGQRLYLSHVQSCGTRGVANCLPKPPTRRRESEERLSAIDERRWKHRGRERYVCCCYRPRSWVASEKSRTHYFSLSSFLGSLEKESAATEFSGGVLSF